MCNNMLRTQDSVHNTSVVNSNPADSLCLIYMSTVSSLHVDSSMCPYVYHVMVMVTVMGMMSSMFTTVP